MSSGRRISDFERLTKPGGRAQPDDETIPVLTERLALPSLEIDTSLPTAATPPAEDAPAAPIEAPAEALDGSEETVFPGAEQSGDAQHAEHAEHADHSEHAEHAAAPAAPAMATAADAAPAAEPPAAAAGMDAADTVPIDWAQVEDEARERLLHELQPRLASELDRQLRERLQPTLVRMLLATVTELRPAIEAAVREAVAQAVAAEVARRRTGD